MAAMSSMKRWILTASILGSGIVFLDSTVVGVALPKIGQELPSKLFGVLEAQSYVYNGYLLSLSALLILAGALNDYYGRRRMFAIGLAGFGVTSLLCGVSPNMELLILFRVLQGATGALLVPGSLALISANFDGEAQGRAYGLWAGASAGTTILGPFIGGILVDTVSWRAAFLINVPLVALGLYATLRHVPESRDEESTGRFDWLGAFVVAVAIGGLAYGAIRGQERNWQDASAFVALAAGGLAAIAFPFMMARSSHPLVPLGLFKSRNFTITNISTLVIYGALYVTFYNLGLFSQGTLGYTAAAAGLISVPGTLLLVLFSSRFGRLAARYGPRLFMALGPTLMAVGLLLLTQVPTSSSPWRFELKQLSTWAPSSGYLSDLLPGMFVFGLGLAIMVAPLTTALMTSVPKHNSGLASAINNAISRVGPQLGGALIFIAITASFYGGLGSRVAGLDTSSQELRKQISPLNKPDPSVPPDQVAAANESSTHALHLALSISAGMLLAGAAVNALGISNRQALDRTSEEHEAIAPERPPVAGTAGTKPGPAPEGEAPREEAPT